MPRRAVFRRALLPVPWMQAALAGLTLVCGCAGAGPASHTGPSPADGVAVAALRRTLPALMDSGGVPGLAIAVVQGGRVTWAGGFGVVGGAGSAAVDAHTVFEVASLSKPVFAYAALRLADRGVLELDRPLWDYLEEPALAGDPRARRITARMVLSHTTGLQNERIGDAPLALAFTPGQEFRYSGEGFAYLGRVLERITGMPLEELMRREVFAPLGMTRSGYVWRNAFAPNAATGHGGYGDPLAPTRPLDARAPSSLHTTAHDYALFLAAAVRGVGLRPATHAEWLAPRVQVAGGVAWALGWSVEAGGPRPLIWHHGDNSNSGFTAFAIADPAAGAALVYLANSTTGLGIAGEVLARAGGPFAGAHTGVAWMGRERYDAPARIVRLAMERRIRENGVAAGIAFYRQARSSYPADAFPEGLLNSLGYRLLSLGRPADAVAVFELNAAEFPTSANVHDSLGDGYAAAGDRVRAIRSYERSLALDPGNAHAAEQIVALRRQAP
jgi:CubicO group peptidase (beta-lactamase class C family)